MAERCCTPPEPTNNNAPTAEGQSLHGDHLYAFYQVPQNPKALPIVMLHGAYQSARSWETTSDGREGFQNIFLRRDFPVYLVDQPRRGRAGNSTVAATIEPTPYDQLFFDQFRIGNLAQLFRRRAVRPQAGDAEPVLPLGHAEHRALRCRRDLGRDVGAVQQDRSGAFCSLTPRPAGRVG